MTHEIVPINISRRAREKTDRLLSVNEIRERLWDFDHTLYVSPNERQFHLVGPEIVIVFTIDSSPRHRIAVITQMHTYHNDYEQNDKYSEVSYDSIHELANAER